MHLHGNERLESETSELFNLFLEKTGGTGPANFRGVCMEDIAIVEDIIQADIFLYDMHIVDGSMIGELARRSVRKHSNTVRLSGYKSHLLCLQYQRSLQNLSLSIIRSIHENGSAPARAFDYLQRKS